MMPTTLVASIIMLYRKGISQVELTQKIQWLGMIIAERGATFGCDQGLPGTNTMKIGLDILKPYLTIKGNMIEPKIS